MAAGVISMSHAWTKQSNGACWFAVLPRSVQYDWPHAALQDSLGKEQQQWAPDKPVKGPEGEREACSTGKEELLAAGACPPCHSSHPEERVEDVCSKCFRLPVPPPCLLVIFYFAGYKERVALAVAWALQEGARDTV